MPPPQPNLPLIHKLDAFYRNIYLLGKQIPKRDHFGVFLKIENVLLAVFELVITAALETKINKVLPLNSARVKIEVLKRLIRLVQELKIIEANKYLALEKDLQEISKMINGWIKYLK